MKKFLFYLCAVLAVCSASHAGSFEDELEAAFAEGEFEGAFEACFEMAELMEDDPQCQCIYEVVRHTLSEEDLQTAAQFLEKGRYGSAKRLLKKALVPARNECD